MKVAGTVRIQHCSKGALRQTCGEFSLTRCVFSFQRRATWIDDPPKIKNLSRSAAGCCHLRGTSSYKRRWLEWGDGASDLPLNIFFLKEGHRPPVSRVLMYFLFRVRFWLKEPKRDRRVVSRGRHWLSLPVLPCTSFAVRYTLNSQIGAPCDLGGFPGQGLHRS